MPKPLSLNRIAELINQRVPCIGYYIAVVIGIAILVIAEELNHL